MCIYIYIYIYTSLRNALPRNCNKIAFNPFKQARFYQKQLRYNIPKGASHTISTTHCTCTTTSKLRCSSLISDDFLPNFWECKN